MGIAVLTLAGFFTPFQSLAHRLVPRLRAQRALSTAGLRYVGVRPGCASRQRAEAPLLRHAASGGEAVRPVHVLRVSRTVDPAQPGTSRHAGRLVISGRMADVCAELDRLVALETAHHGAKGSRAREPRAQG